MTTGRFKFRVWDGERFFYWGFNDSKHGLTFRGLASNSSNPLSLEEIMQRSEQCTGCLDKNEVEIWEGDIVSPINFNGSYEAARIIWHDGAFCVESLGKCKDTEYLGEKINFALIGNVHQNSELLK